ncbi:MAG: NAD(P)-binding domain-containing protein [Acidimicrobiia bacterium]|nr:NAD(P)-binding domain-containing protein [Acidimicrobiia bacterium]
MHATETVIIGAGQAGLALSRHLTSAGRDHVVVDRGRLAERWRSERWDSLRLLTPNWMTRLPGWSYDGPDPDGFMTAAEVVAFFEAYAASFGAPVLEGVTVESVEPAGGGFRVSTDAVTWRTANVVVATGAADVPRVPGLAGHLPAHVHQITPSRYRNPAGLPDGGVLVVGASSSGLQIADELARAGRRAVLAVGDHNRMPRRYRGRDVMWWLDRTGVFDTRIEDVPHPERSRRSPSMQLVGRPDHGDLDLGTVHRQGVELAGRLVDVDGGVVRFADDLAATTARAEARLCRVLDGIDACIAGAGLDARVAPPDRPAPSTSPPRRGTCTCAVPASARSSGPPDTGRPTRGCACPGSTTARASPRPGAPSRASTGCSCWASASRPAAAPTSSTASATTPAWSPTGSRAGPRREPPPDQGRPR